MKVALFSDIHGNLFALKSILKSIEKEHVDKIICLGDVIGLGPNSKECLDLIIKYHIIFILGNHELYYLNDISSYPQYKNEFSHHQWIKNNLNNSHMDFLKKCQLSYLINYKNNKILFQHFLLKDNSIDPFYEIKDIENIEFEEYDYIFVGHNHSPFKVNNIYGIGSSGCNKNDETSYFILNLNETINIEIKKVEYDKKGLYQELLKENYPDRNFISKIFFNLNIEGD